MFHQTHCLFLHYMGKQNQQNITFLFYFVCSGFSQVVQKQTFDELGTRTVV